MYDFGKNPAGLIEDGNLGEFKFTASYLRGTRFTKIDTFFVDTTIIDSVITGIDTVEYIIDTLDFSHLGSPFTGLNRTLDEREDILDFIYRSLSGIMFGTMGERSLWLSPLSEGGYIVYRNPDMAMRVTGEYSDTKYTQKDTSEGYTTPYGVFTGAGRLEDGFIGVETGYLKSSYYTSPRRRLERTGRELSIFPYIKLGVIGAFERNEFGVTYSWMSPKIDYYKKETDSLGDVLYEERFSLTGGNWTLGIQGIFNLRETGSLGMRLDYSDQSGKIASNNIYGMYNLDDISSGFKTILFQALGRFSPEPSPLIFAVTMDFITGTFKTWHDTLEYVEPTNYELSFLDIGGGIGVEFHRVFLGFEGNYGDKTERDVELNEETKGSEVKFKTGVELRATDFLSLRGGYLISKLDPNRDLEDDEDNISIYTFGAGFSPDFLPFEVDIAVNLFNRKNITLPDNRMKYMEIMTAILGSF